MPIFEKRSLFSGVPVSEAMRRQVVSLQDSAGIGQGIRWMIRYKTNAVLLKSGSIPCGVVSKTDLMGAFYVGLAIDTPLADVMGSQPIACFPDDPLEDALEIMEAAEVHQLYVTGADRQKVVGVVAYADILGLLYRYCRSCERSMAGKRQQHGLEGPTVRLLVKDVMALVVPTCRDDEPLSTVVDTLTTHQTGAVLIQDSTSAAVGVISKTDLILAYLHGDTPETPARRVMNTPIRSVPSNALLSAAIQQMLTWDVQRLFVRESATQTDPVVGVLALSNAARSRSGSCRACTAGRILTQ